MSEQTMPCASCGKVKNWRDGFPSRIAAVCWQCSWGQHMQKEHPLPRSTRRRIRRTARRVARNELVRQAESEMAAAGIALADPRVDSSGRKVGEVKG